MELIHAVYASVVPQEDCGATRVNSATPQHSPLLLPSSTPCTTALQAMGLAHTVLPNNSSWPNWTELDWTGGGEEAGFVPSVAGVLIPLIYLMVCMVGLVGNTLVIYVVLNYQRAESVTNIYILNLAIADELFMLGLPFLAVQNALLSWPFGPLVCRVVMTVDAINQFTSIFCLTVMSMDRYVAVVHPVRSSRWRRPRVAKAINGAVWAVSSVVVLPVVAFAGVLAEEEDGSGRVCSIVWPEPAAVWKTAFIVYTATVGFLFPLLVICLCYLLIVIKVRSAGKRVRAASSRRRKSERKITRMVVVVVVVFVLCWLPFYALNVVNLLVVLPRDLRWLYFFVVVLSYANSCANPILYGFLSDNFKRGFRKALCRSSRRVDDHKRAVGTAVGTECKRTAGTEEWPGVELQPRNGPGNDKGRGGDGEEEEEEEEEGVTGEMKRGADDTVRMAGIGGIVPNGNSGGMEERCQALFPRDGETTEPEPTGQSASAADMCGEGPGSCPAEAMSTLATGSERRSNRSPAEASTEERTVLEMSFL